MGFHNPPPEEHRKTQLTIYSIGSYVKTVVGISAESRILRPGLALITPEEARDDSDLRRGFDQLDGAIGRWIEREKVPA